MAKDKNKGALLRLKGEALLFQLIGFCVVLPMGFMMIVAVSMIPGNPDSNSMLTVLVVTFIMTAAGIGLIAHGAKKKRIIRRFQDYMLHFTSSGSDSVMGLAGAMGVSCPTATACLEELLQYGFFPGAYIDKGEMRLIMPRAQRKREYSTDAVGTPRVRAVTCPHCGASAAVPAGEAVQCEYCGSMIS